MVVNFTVEQPRVSSGWNTQCVRSLGHLSGLKFDRYKEENAQFQGGVNVLF